jgi:hypothetical protein
MEEKDENRRRKNRRKSNDPLIAPPMRQKKSPWPSYSKKRRAPSEPLPYIIGAPVLHG